tara:strand:+ start:561 stop:1250 length:690 start_codon:yes stop_codon:yes gene_type:complete
MKLSIIIPCYNEQKTISVILDKVRNLKDYDKEIIVVDDCSTDGTKEILKKLENSIEIKILYNDKNRGKGYCIKKGIDSSTGSVLIIQDADLEYDPNDIPKLINPIKNGNADVVYGSRFAGSEEKRVLFYWHSLGNKFLTTLSNMFTNLNLTDMECCYKAFKSKIIKDINLKENRFGFEPEITAKISKKDIQIYEVGIKYFGRKYSEGKKITWVDGFRAIYCIIFYSFFD